MIPAILIILTIHIIIAIRWMLIKILSVVINHHGEYKVIVVGDYSIYRSNIPDAAPIFVYSPSCSFHLPDL